MESNHHGMSFLILSHRHSPITFQETDLNNLCTVSQPSLFIVRQQGQSLHTPGRATRWSSTPGSSRPVGGKEKEK